MRHTIIFDLSEVLIAGLLGIEVPLSQRLGITQQAVLNAFNNHLLHELFCGRLSEDAYLDHVIAYDGWDITADEIKGVIRHNFHRRVPGTGKIVTRLAAERELILLSDHAADWVAYIEAVHPFLETFERRFFSCRLGQTKREPSTFRRVLDHIGRAPEECLFVDDSQRNIQAAASAGIPSLHFVSAEQLAHDLTDRGLYR